VTPGEPTNSNSDMFDPVASRALLDTLIARSRLYRTTKEYKDLLDFVVRLRNFAPFNAMLLQIQKPGLLYAASEADWHGRFGRKPKEGARPLLILWPFGPIALVYDVEDTEGKDLPRDVSAFFAQGPVGESAMVRFKWLCGRKDVAWVDLDTGGAKAGSIACTRRAASKAEHNTYKVSINKNHSPVVRFSTLAHELAHLFLGHLGPDSHLSIPLRQPQTVEQRELEAESVAYLVCKRSHVETNSEAYLSDYTMRNSLLTDLDIYQVMRAAGQVEALLEIGGRSTFKFAKGQID
jgi:IrrE N-terminal-like domain